MTFLCISCGQPASKKPVAQADTAQLSPSVGPDQMATEETKNATADTASPRKTDLVLRDADAQLLDSGTVIGKGGDLLITITGRGFAFTANNPAVIAGKVRYDKTYSNEEGSEMYLVIPAKDIDMFFAAARGELQVLNPGIDSRPVSLKVEKEVLMRKAAANSKGVLVFTKFGVARKEGIRR